MVKVQLRVSLNQVFTRAACRVVSVAAVMRCQAVGPCARSRGPLTADRGRDVNRAPTAL